MNSAVFQPPFPCPTREVYGLISLFPFLPSGICISFLGIYFAKSEERERREDRMGQGSRTEWNLLRSLEKTEEKSSGTTMVWREVGQKDQPPLWHSRNAKKLEFLSNSFFPPKDCFFFLRTRPSETLFYFCLHFIDFWLISICAHGKNFHRTRWKVNLPPISDHELSNSLSLV